MADMKIDEEAAVRARMPEYDPADPYKLPALMPSSADRSVRSFDPDDFPEPDHRSDEWRYAPIDDLRDFFRPFEASGTTSVAAMFGDGTPVPALSGAHPVEFGPIDPGHGPAGSVGKPTDKVSAVQWQASVRSGRMFWLRVDRSCDRPLIVRLHGQGSVTHGDTTGLNARGQNAHGQGAALDAVHLVITVADDARADIVLDHTGRADLAEGVEIRTGARSHVNLSSIQEWDAGSRHLGSQRIEVGAGAELQHNVISLSGSVVRLRMDPQFRGTDGFLNMLGIYFADPGSYMEHRTMVVHNHPSCRSRVIYKGALDGTGARSAWVGNALILPTAPKTDSYELNRNLVLSPGAIANSEPQLEIENGDIVGAGHASSVGRFDDEQLFYLESRGIGVEEARKLVVRGFFADLIGQIGVESVEKHLMDSIDRRLARGESKDIAEILEEH